MLSSTVLLILEQRAASLLGREREMSAGLKDRRIRGRGKERKKERTLISFAYCSFIMTSLVLLRGFKKL